MGREYEETVENINIKNLNFLMNFSPVKIKRKMYKVDVDMLNTLKSVLADILSVSPLCFDEGLMLETSANTLYSVQHIHINLTLIHCTFYCHTDADQN